MRTPSGGARTNIGGYLVANMRQPHIKCARARRNYATNAGQGLTQTKAVQDLAAKVRCLITLCKYSSMTASVLDPAVAELTVSEHNALRYAAGYIDLNLPTDMGHC